ncbi:hypothetical protein V495_08761 [Pseudogymnoascus sp. VKM F-4514 (FW-929)]|nr:hypothetical protein V495_08761 [Pseudogymnoascus sp. VKM F-4514 (FW-929)]KFY58213.1 hypothetical protein V497_04980 [Pseudogymnoascus sp. VKM F-4516 (FW-969)]
MVIDGYAWAMPGLALPFPILPISPSPPTSNFSKLRGEILRQIQHAIPTTSLLQLSSYQLLQINRDLLETLLSLLADKKLFPSYITKQQRWCSIGQRGNHLFKQDSSQ